MTMSTTFATGLVIFKKTVDSVSITFPGHKSMVLTRDGLHVAILAAKANIEQGRRPYWVERLHAYQAGLKLLQAGEKGEL